MSDHSIKGIYEMRLSNNLRAIIISAKNKIDPLKYDYYLLYSDNESDNVDIKKISSPILLAKDSKYSIHKLDSEGDAYKHFAARFASYRNDPIQTSRKLHFKEPRLNTTRLTKGNQYKKRT